MTKPLDTRQPGYNVLNQDAPEDHEDALAEVFARILQEEIAKEQVRSLKNDILVNGLK